MTAQALGEDEAFFSSFEKALPEYVASRRWYRSKARKIERIQIEDRIELTGSPFHFLVLRMQHADGEGDRYLLPISLGAGAGAEDVLARVNSAGGETEVHNALADPAFREALLRAVACESNFGGKAGELIAKRTDALKEACDGALGDIDSFVSRAEQSNTSIVYRDRYIFKLFRKLEAGLNPDIELGKFLTERGFKNTPAVLGSLEYRSFNGELHAAGLLQQFVPNQGDAWKYTLDSLGDFFRTVLASGKAAPVIRKAHPLDLMNEAPAPELSAAAGPYFESAALLGRRTAQMHAALTDASAGPDLKPEPFTSQGAAKLYRDLIGQADMTYGLLRRTQAGLSGSVADAAHEFLRIEQRVGERFAGLQDRSFSTLEIRHHGDYHLGQVLYTGRDFMIIDFEGEPARPLAERRAKALALRDVAGMVRSFQYAAYAALFGQIPGVPTDPQTAKTVEAWAEAWNSAASGAYLRGYFDEAKGADFVGASEEERRILLDAFLLQKALYEVAYELNNRPDWLLIPLRGILSLMA